MPSMTEENAIDSGNCLADETCPEKDFCGPGDPNTKPNFLYNEDNCFGNAFYLGIYGAIGAAIAMISFTKVSYYRHLFNFLQLLHK